MSCAYSTKHSLMNDEVAKTVRKKGGIYMFGVDLITRKGHRPVHVQLIILRCRKISW